MTTHDPQAGSADHVIVRAGQADIGVLSQVIADAFFSLTVCRWLIPDGPARRAAFPGYFGLYVEHAIAGGLVETTPDRAAAALWIPGEGPGEPPDGYAGQLADITGPYLSNFLAFDEQLDRHHPAGTFHHHLAILAVRPDRQHQGIGTAFLRAHHAAARRRRASPPTWRHQTRALAGSTWATATPITAAPSSSPAARSCTPCSA